MQSPETTPTAQAIPIIGAVAHSAAATVLRTAAAQELTESIREPAAVVNELREVVFANQHFLGLARAGHLDEVLGRRLGELLGIIPRGTAAAGNQPKTVHPVTEALEGRAASATSTVTFSADPDATTHISISAVPLRLRDRTFALVQFSPAGTIA